MAHFRLEHDSVESEHNIAAVDRAKLVFTAAVSCEFGHEGKRLSRRTWYQLEGVEHESNSRRFGRLPITCEAVAKSAVKSRRDVGL
jgi:hypothetical protein